MAMSCVVPCACSVVACLANHGGFRSTATFGSKFTVPPARALACPPLYLKIKTHAGDDDLRE
eukprot:959948-Alexandrium_andersonii.AAC.1